MSSKPDALRIPRMRVSLAAVVVVFMITMQLAGCSSQGSSTECSLSECTITLQRGVDANAQILGVEARLIGVNRDQAVLEVAGQRVALRVDQQVQIAGLQVSLQRLTEQEVVVRIGQGAEIG